MPILEDASAPAVLHSSGTTSPVSTALFSPPANSLVLAMVCAPWATLNNSVGISLSDSGAHTWTNAVTETAIHNGSNNAGGSAAIFRSYFAAAPGAISCSAAFTNIGGGSSIVIKVLTGAAPNQSGAAVASAEFGHVTNVTTGSTTIVTSASGSLVYGIAADGERGGVFAANGSTSVIDNWVDTSDVVTIDTIKSSAVTSAPGPLALGGTWGTATQSIIALCEVVPTGAAPPSSTFNPQFGGMF